MNRRPAHQGFTLLEVLVATLIMAIAITALLSNLSTSLRNAARLTDTDRASLLARRKMDELLTQARLPRGVEFGGPLEPAHGVEGAWRARVTPFEAPPRVVPGMSVLDRIELQLTYKSTSGRDRTFTLEAYHRTKLTELDLGTATP
ncbi:MAG: type II secretion system protein [Bryobacteraceae bacterium]|nr:type II secretion system protein [Bryobacteraceae bacterium]